MIYPLPAVLVTVGETPKDYNIITIAWTGTICSDPPMCYISVRPGRHSYAILKRTNEFVINLTTLELAYATDWCGVKSGRDVNKFQKMKLTPGPAAVVKAPVIMESPINIECRVVNVVPLGSHDMFVATVVNVQADEKYINSKTGVFSLSQARPICYSHGQYYELGARVGKFGYSVEKKKHPHKRATER